MKKIALIIAFVFLPSFSFAATIYVNSSTGNDTTGEGVSVNPYRTFTKGYTMASANDTLDLSGTFSWSDTAETGDNTTTGFIIGKNLTIRGQGAGQTIVQASTTENTATRRVFTLAATTSVTIDGITMRYGKTTGSGSTDEGGAVLNLGTSTIKNSIVSYSRSTGSWGGGISNQGVLTVASSSILYNTTNTSGGGIVNSFYVSGTGYLTVENSTIAYNQQTQTSAYTDGGGIFLRKGKGTFTNNTIAYNTATGIGGLGMDDSAGYMVLKNNLIIKNFVRSGASHVDFGYRSSGQGSVTDNGGNIVGYSQHYSFVGSNDWTDQSRTGRFTKYGTAVTGYPYLETALSTNDAASGLLTLELGTGSIAIDNGETGSNGATSTVPTTDQRGGTRDATPDSGAFEYNATLTVTQPTVQASSITMATTSYNHFTFSWTNGGGAKRIVFMKQTSEGTATPVDGTTYTANSVFGSGTQIGSSGWYAVYKGNGTSTMVTGLSSGTAYTIQVFEYNGITAGAENYFADTATNNPRTQSTYTPTTIYVNTSTGSDSGAGSAGSPYQTFTKAYTMANSGDTINASGTFTWTDASETGDSAIVGFVIGKDLTIEGVDPETTIFQAATASTTGDRRVFTINATSQATTTATIKNVTIRHGRLTASSYIGAGVGNFGSTTIMNSEIYDNLNAGDNGGGLGNRYILNLFNNAIWRNTANNNGGGVTNDYYIMPGGYLTMINNTVVRNQQTATTAYTEGGGVHLRRGSATLTNNTIAYNTAGTVGGLGMDDSTATVTLKNNIIANNIMRSSANYIDFGFRSSGQGNVVDNGYNIVGVSQNYTFSGTGDWKDQSRTGTFTLQGGASTGSLNISSTLGVNSNPRKTQTLALSSGSIAINNGATGSNGSTSTVPTLDQRGASRSGTIDIGAFEFGGSLTDTTGPVISSIASSTTSTTATVTWTTDENATSTIFYGLSTSYGLSSTTLATSTSHSFSLSGLTASTVYHFMASSTDQYGNTSTSSDYTFTTAEPSEVNLSAISATSYATSATITWTTDVSASTKIVFGATTNYSSTTREVDTAPRVTSHSFTLIHLPRCALINYAVVSRTASGASATSTNKTVATKGCIGSADITASEQYGITTAAGGTLTNDRMRLTVPTSFTGTSSSAVFQANKLDGSTFFGTAGNPTGKNRAGTTVFNLKALTDATTTLSSFSAPITVTMEYEDEDVDGVDEDTLKIYRYDNDEWNELDDCEVDKDEQTVSCTTQNFSDFALFGDEEESEEESTTTRTAKKSTQTLQNRLENIIKYSAPIAVVSQSTRDLELGMSGDDVKELQLKLIAKNAGPKARALAGVGATGYFGPYTKAAVIEFQTDQAIYPPYGYFGPRTRAVLK